MTVEQIDERWQARRQAWIALVQELVDQVQQWAGEENWSLHRENKQIAEDVAGAYEVPALRIRNVSGEVRLDPIGLHIVGAEGRVDVEAWPSLNRVKLLRRGGKWIIMTDSNVPLRDEWGRDAFVRLVNDLLASA